MFTNRSLFRDRRDAGQQLAAALLYLKESAPVVLALPRGGVPVAYEVAKTLHAPLDVFLVRKIGAPYFPELGIGAVAEGKEPHRILNQDMVQRVHASEEYLEDEQRRQVEEIARRRELYRGGRELIDLQDRTVIVVDDGIATGGTMKAALQAVAAAGPERLVFGVPVAPRETVASLQDFADEGVCLHSPEGFRSVSQYYADFEQTGDEEVVRLLREAESEPHPEDEEKESGHQTSDEMQPPRPASDQAGDRL